MALTIKSPLVSTVNGDATIPWTPTVFAEMHQALTGTDTTTTRGVLKGVLESMTCSGSATPVVVHTGWVCIQGRWAKHTADANVTVSTPATSTRKDLIYAEVDIEAAHQVATVAKTAGTEGGDFPALGGDANHQRIPLWGVTITTGGAITLTDKREYISLATEIRAGQFNTDASGKPYDGTTIINTGGTLGVGTAPESDKVDGLHAATSGATAHVVATDAGGNATVVNATATGGLNVGSATGAGTGEIQASGGATAAFFTTAKGQTAIPKSTTVTIVSDMPYGGLFEVVATDLGNSDWRLVAWVAMRQGVGQVITTQFSNNLSVSFTGNNNLQLTNTDASYDATISWGVTGLHYR